MSTSPTTIPGLVRTCIDCPAKACYCTLPPPTTHANPTSIGLWANKYISPGTQIVCETPILQITALSPDPSSPCTQPPTALSRVPEIFANSHDQGVPAPLHPEGPGGGHLGLGLGQAHLVRATVRGGTLVGESTWVLPRLISRIKHSCLPNAVSVYEASRSPPQLRVIAMRPIAAGEEITVSYYLPAVLISGVVERRAAVWRVFGFVCRCVRCRLEERPQTLGIGGARGWEGYLRDVRKWVAEGEDVGRGGGGWEGKVEGRGWRRLLGKWWGKEERENLRWDLSV